MTTISPRIWLLIGRPACAASLCLAFEIAPVLAQGHPTLTLSGGLMTAFGGSGVSGSVRLEAPSRHVASEVRLIWGAAGWLAQTTVEGSTVGLKRNLGGLGPLVGLRWTPGGSGWHLTASAGVEVVQSARQKIDFPAAMGVSAPTTYGTTGATAISLRFNTPPGAAMVELGSVATRPAFDGGWWMRYELGLRFRVGRR